MSTLCITYIGIESVLLQAIALLHQHFQPRGRHLLLLSWVILVAIFYWEEMNEVTTDRQSSPKHKSNHKDVIDCTIAFIASHTQPIINTIHQSIVSMKTKHRRHQPINLPRRKGWNQRTSSKILRLYAASVIAMAAANQSRYVEDGEPFDTDSMMVGIDN